MDIMQMGGGDSLYDKIDKGIRNCQVVISCVTSKYSISPNCRREVSLADALKKPIIPLLLEKMTWPPEGPMSMVLTQLLYIDFCSKGFEGQNNWDIDEFDVLMDKIRKNLEAKKRAVRFGDEIIPTNLYDVTQDDLLQEIQEDDEDNSDSNVNNDLQPISNSKLDEPRTVKESSVHNQDKNKSKHKPPPIMYPATTETQQGTAEVVAPKSSCCCVQ